MDVENNDDAFGTWDYVVLSLMLIISASIGVYYRFTGGKQKTTQEYLHGDKDLSVIPVAVSLMASFMSAITILGVSTENYTFGTQFVVINFGYGIATPFAAYCFLPVFFKMQATSAYQYLEIRFGATTRLCTSLAFSLQMVLYMGIVLYAPAIALEAVTGISKTVAILSVGIVCTFYSTIGGMKAVVVTDVFQSLLMFAAVFLVIIKGAIDVGGLGEIWRIAKEGYRLEFDNTNPDPTVRHTWWSLILGGGFTYCSLYAVNQTQVQRLLTLRDLRRSQIALWLSWPVLTLLSLSTSFAGLAIYSKYYNCDPLKSGRISSSDQLMPLFVGDTMREFPGLCGLFVAGIFSGSLSTVSSALNSLAAVTLEDYLKPVYLKIYKKSIPENRTGFISKLLALLYGLVCLAIAFTSEHLGGILQASLTIFGVVGGPLLGVFTLGMFCPCANEVGAVSGLIGGLIIAFWIGFGGPKPPPLTLPVSIESCYIESNTFGSNSTFGDFEISTENSTFLIEASNLSSNDDEYFYLYRLSYMWYVLIGFFVTILIGLVVGWTYSMFFKTKPPPSDPNLFAPFVRRFVRRRTSKSDGSSIEVKNYIKVEKLDPRGAIVSTSTESLKQDVSLL
uniref:Sodium-dependent multivitamin transporter n=1 Tax=Timema tahoe TaxID=61484 RepID=A0A7R9FES5_9NEOP|nr:unnamed protein product [Timema tahoe]